MSEVTAAAPAASGSLARDEPCAGCGHSRGKHTLVDGPCLVRFADPLTEDDLCQCDEFEPSW